MTHHLKKHIPSEAAMLATGRSLAASIENGAVIFLYGPLGAGKTTFTRGFLQGLGFHGKVKSPTYTIVEPYEVEGRQVFHFDFYRISHAQELSHIGLQEYFVPSSICIVEWPEKGFPILPQPDLACYIDFATVGREINLQSHSERGDKSFARL